MTQQVKILLPKLGESILSATVVRWFKKCGDSVALDEPLLEVSTDKVNSEIPSPVAGVLKEICAEVDQELKVGDLLGILTSGAEGSTSVVAKKTQTQGFFSPAVIRLAQETGISLSELEKIPGTGAGGRITKCDLEAQIKKPKACPMTAAVREDVERLKMSGMRKAIADNMVRSFYGAPHASLITEVDVTSVLKLIAEQREAFLAKHGCKLTITSFVARSIAAALREYPLINSSLEEDTILVKRFDNLGIAVSVDQGLMVPVIKRCEGMDLPRIATTLGELTHKAKVGKLTPDETTEGTITLTNFGMSGVQIGVPIIRYPEVAIVGMGAIYKRVVPLDDDVLAIRSLMHVSLTFDHRVLDGMYGCGFMNALKKHIEEDSLNH